MKRLFGAFVVLALVPGLMGAKCRTQADDRPMEGAGCDQCPTTYAPVCADPKEGGGTFDNQCFAECWGFTVDHVGVCTAEDFE